MMQKVLFSYFVFINVVTFFVYGVDKFFSKRTKAGRISERELHTFALIGGFLGATLAMALFRHKVSKGSFLLKHIIILIGWIAAILYYFTYIDVLNFMR